MNNYYTYFIENYKNVVVMTTNKSPTEDTYEKHSSTVHCVRLQWKACYADMFGLST